MNSLSTMPSLRSRHSSVSTSPVEMAVLGMSPSAELRGMRTVPAGSALFVQGLTLIVI